MSLVPAGKLSIEKPKDEGLTFTPKSEGLIGIPWLLKFTSEGIEVNRETATYRTYTSKDFANTFKKLIRDVYSPTIYEKEVNFSVTNKVYMTYNPKKDSFKFNHDEFPSIKNNASTFVHWVIGHIEG